MNVADSSAWIEFLIEGPNAGHFAPILNDRTALIVPTIAVYEVYRWMERERSVDHADAAVAVMTESLIVDLDIDLAIDAADLAAEHHLAMADSIILATAQRYEATLWTQDADFEGLLNVRYLPRT